MRFVMPVATALLTLLSGFAKGDPPVNPNRLVTDVKSLDHACVSILYSGVIGSIDADSLTIVVEERGKKQSVTLVPVDMLRKGGVVRNSSGQDAYRWSDVQKGDTVLIHGVKDEGDGWTYCVEICIQRRPGAELPKSQRPDEDQRFKSSRVYNAIENGEDVTEEELLTAFPKRLNPVTKEYSTPGLPVGNKYRDMLNANRERLALRAAASGMAATPPKDDKK